MWESTQFSNLQTELKYLDLFKFHYVLTDLGHPPWEWVDVGVGGYRCGMIQFSNLQTELKYLDLFKFYYVLTDLGGAPLSVGGVCGCGYRIIHSFQNFRQN